MFDVLIESNPDLKPRKTVLSLDLASCAHRCPDGSHHHPFVFY